MEIATGPGERNSGPTWGRGINSTPTSQDPVSPRLQNRYFFPLPEAGAHDGGEKFIHSSIIHPSIRSYLHPYTLQQAFMEYLLFVGCWGYSDKRREQTHTLKEMTDRTMMQLHVS